MAAAATVAAATGIAKGGVKGLYFCHAFKLRSIWP